jgi:hypothetical protein
MWGTIDESEAPWGRGARLEAEQRENAVDVDEQERRCRGHA